ncbi:glycerol-3-phosphate responsive antiterminator [Bacillus sp. FSL K6-3431]|uniref:glycerol-3-phosphate responsive antiterminator n=1 Tax=Bacillus sp. FSL K6-3431 TaxID=2921500 RepID=UPI0030F8ADB1
MVNIVDMVDSLIIPSVQNETDLEKAIQSKSSIVFILTGNLINMESYLNQLKKANKYTYIHMDFIEGLSNTKSAIKYIANVWKPTGIITTKASMIKYAKAEKLKTIQRIFLIDHSAVLKGIESSKACSPDAVEVLPGLMPTVIDQLSQKLELPIIVGGLISNKQDILSAIQAGALAVSSGSPELWSLEL